MTFHRRVPIYNLFIIRVQSRPLPFFFLSSVLCEIPQFNNIYIFFSILTELSISICGVLGRERQRERKYSTESPFHQIVAQPTSPPI